MKQLALAAIRLYQRHLSPHKGFCCAYRCHTGHASCSQLGYRSIRRFGLRRGLFLLRQRLLKCGIAHRRHAPRRGVAFRQQAGFCDLSCDLPCDGDCSPCDLIGEWGSSRKDEQDERPIHLTPGRQSNREA